MKMPGSGDELASRLAQDFGQILFHAVVGLHDFFPCYLLVQSCSSFWRALAFSDAHP